MLGYCNSDAWIFFKFLTRGFFEKNVDNKYQHHKRYQKGKKK